MTWMKFSTSKRIKAQLCKELRMDTENTPSLMHRIEYTVSTIKDTANRASDPNCILKKTTTKVMKGTLIKKNRGVVRI
eukprot:CAMPEP_0204910654 /NCGR_PEP_ID=MMETSP1397-20131031/9128_1 /ASSEMBLY_ACC=CAM_ASM_000891 /TAXON_ID=49980 /ORGANISM="Climacostomum Climacostomum virens, Strain Stock W-24" /LENGTH=77 /DNA_ID=CAMNT_0052080895 /DNA_START=597 /DNA_END=830 /DNA_ORIENTATION=+